ASPVVVQPLVSAVGIGQGYAVISSSLLLLGAIALITGSLFLSSNSHHF
ncbi:MAG: hypothetical protein GVY17_03810, partial [Cyanobacteria bacterium]|nr:hypothetical protein [Cyanobacteria bacterium GSL.Bin21]